MGSSPGGRDGKGGVRAWAQASRLWLILRARVLMLLGRGLSGTVMRGLVPNLGVFVGLPLVLNGVIFGLGWNRAGGMEVGLPPGWVVGALWVVLFAGMGTARWLLLRVARGQKEQRPVEWVSLLAFLCLLYPLYTAGLRDDRVGLVGNVLTVVVGVAVAVFAWKRVRAAGMWVAAVCAWLVYAAGATAYGIWR